MSLMESLQLPLFMPSIFHCLFFLPLLIQLFSWTYHHLTKKKPRQPPSPAKLPVIGNLHQLGGHAQRSLKALADVHGPLMLVHLGTTPCLIASSATTAKEIMKTHDIAFSSRSPSFVGERLLYNYKDIAVAPYGEHWRQARRVSMVHLLSAARVRSARPVREEEVANMLDKITAVSGESDPVNLSEVVKEMSNNFTCRTALGKRYYSRESGGVSEVLSEFIDLMGYINVGDLIPWLAWMNRLNGFEARVERNHKSLDLLLDRVLEDHAAGETESGSFVDVLVSLEKENSVTGGFSLGKDGIKAVLLDMFSGGSHTGFTVIDWTMTELVRHPEMMAKAQAEVRACGKGKTMVDEDDIEKMSYLKCVIKEVLRLHPPLPLLVPRESISDVELQGSYSFPKGTRVMINAWAIARDPEWWGKPDEFSPERFEVDNTVDYRGMDFQLIPFGCPGMHFGVALVELAVANLLYRFDFELPEGVRAEDLDMTEASGLITNRKSGLLLVARPYLV